MELVAIIAAFVFMVGTLGWGRYRGMLSSGVLLLLLLLVPGIATALAMAVEGESARYVVYAGVLALLLGGLKLRQVGLTNTCRRIASRLGLGFEVDARLRGTISGELHGCRVQAWYTGKEAPRARASFVQVQVPGGFEALGLSFEKRGLLAGQPGVETGDRVFDKLVRPIGRPTAVLALLRPAARRKLALALRNGVKITPEGLLWRGERWQGERVHLMLRDLVSVATVLTPHFETDAEGLLEALSKEVDSGELSLSDDRDGALSSTD